MSKLPGLICRLKKFSNDIYTVDNTSVLNEQLQELNKLYDEIMDDHKITRMEKEYVLSKYRKFNEVNMYIVPTFKQMSDTIEKSWYGYHNIYRDSDILPLE